MTGKVGFVGVGAMGGPMASNLVKAGFEVFVHDINPERVAPLAAAGARVVDSPAAAAAECRRMICMVETADQADRHTFGAPDNFGTGTQLLPAVRYFAERYKSAPFGFYVFITDGELHDLDEVKRYTVQLARDIAAKRRPPLKCILIGIGHNVNA